ncbi:acid-sensing ion channel 3-like [Branchiostoma floridae x Branchiostoma japonicum]
MTRPEHVTGEGARGVLVTWSCRGRDHFQRGSVRLDRLGPSRAALLNRRQCDNIAVLNVYYEALNYESIVQIPAIETEGLLGDLGGQMGLFLGASFLTLVEVFEYLMDELYGRVLKRCCRCKATASAHSGSPSADVLSVNINGSATQLPQTSRA